MPLECGDPLCVPQKACSPGILAVSLPDGYQRKGLERVCVHLVTVSDCTRSQLSLETKGVRQIEDKLPVVVQGAPERPVSLAKKSSTFKQGDVTS